MAEVVVNSQPSNFDASYGELKYELSIPGVVGEGVNLSNGAISYISSKAHGFNRRMWKVLRE